MSSRFDLTILAISISLALGIPALAAERPATLPMTEQDQKPAADTKSLPGVQKPALSPGGTSTLPKGAQSPKAGTVLRNTAPLPTAPAIAPAPKAPAVNTPAMGGALPKPGVSLPKPAPVAAPMPNIAVPVPNKVPVPTGGFSPAPAAPATPTAVMERSYQAGARYNGGYANWHCEANRCTTTRLANTAITECRALAQAAGRILAFETPAGPLSAPELTRCNSPVISELEVYACSGDDDLRRNSSLRLALLVEGRTFDAHAGGHQLFTEIPSRTCKTARLGRLLIGAFSLSDLKTLSFKFVSGQPTDFRIHNPDDWDMQELIVQGVAREPGGRQTIIRLADRRGNPVARLSDGELFQIELGPR